MVLFLSFGIFFFFQWIGPQFNPQQSSNILPLFWYYVAIGVMSQVFFTVVNLPYTAMTPELSQDYDERTSLNSFRFTFSIGGSILSLILAQMIFSQITNPQQQYLVLAAICTVISVLSLYWYVYGTRDRILACEAKRIKLAEPPEIPFLEQIKIAFSNRPFLFVIAIYLFSWLGVQITASTIIPYFVIYCMGMKNSEVPTVLIAVQTTALLMLFVWSNLSKKFGKKLVYCLGMSL
jgi:GPH family glycoside/pentoside/hexuronide:cation symporter